MALQMMRLALGGYPVATEAPQVVSKKSASAFEEAQVTIVTSGGGRYAAAGGGLRGLPDRAPRQLPLAGVLATSLVPDVRLSVHPASLRPAPSVMHRLVLFPLFKLAGRPR